MSYFKGFSKKKKIYVKPDPTSKVYEGRIVLREMSKFGAGEDQIRIFYQPFLYDNRKYHVDMREKDLTIVREKNLIRCKVKFTIDIEGYAVLMCYIPPKPDPFIKWNAQAELLS